MNLIIMLTKNWKLRINSTANIPTIRDFALFHTMKLQNNKKVGKRHTHQAKDFYDFRTPENQSFAFRLPFSMK